MKTLATFTLLAMAEIFAFGLLAGCSTAPKNGPAIFQPQGTRSFPTPTAK